MIDLQTCLIVCPLVFLAGTVDAIGGGGGLISLPAYLLAGLAPHTAIATNKLSAVCGTAVATTRLLLHVPVLLRLAVPAVICAFAGSFAGACILLYINEDILRWIVVGILPVCAFLVLNKKMFIADANAPVLSDCRTIAVLCCSALLIGFYDGFYGPGTGTFLIIAFTVFVRMNLQSANAYTKIINLTTNIAAAAVYLYNGQGSLLLGGVAAVCNMAGGWIGAGLMLRNGAAIVRPSIIIVLLLLLIKVILG